MIRTVVALACFGAFAVYSVNVKRHVALVEEGGHHDALPIGKPMPDFTLSDRGGTSYTFSALRPQKKVIMVNFWGTWCGPCRVEMPGFEKMYASEARNGLLILSVDEGDSRAELDDYLAKKPVTFPVLLDPDTVLAHRFGVRSFPTTVLVNGDGTIIRIIEGVDENLDDEVEILLKPHSEIQTVHVVR